MIVTLLAYYCIPMRMYQVDIMVLMEAFVSALRPQTLNRYRVNLKETLLDCFHMLHVE